MSRLSLFFLLLVLLCAAEPALGRGGKDGSRPQSVEASGQVRMVGSSPMTSLVISGESREWYIEPEEEKKLSHLQQQIVTVTAQEYYHDIVFANGISGGRRYYLKNITVISP